jgi:hypothetical protein
VLVRIDEAFLLSGNAITVGEVVVVVVEAAFGGVFDSAGFELVGPLFTTEAAVSSSPPWWLLLQLLLLLLLLLLLSLSEEEECSSCLPSEPPLSTLLSSSFPMVDEKKKGKNVFLGEIGGAWRSLARVFARFRAEKKIPSIKKIPTAGSFCRPTPSATMDMEERT